MCTQCAWRTVQLLGLPALRGEVLRGGREALGRGRQAGQRALQRLQPRGHAAQPLPRRVQARCHVDECVVVRDRRVLSRLNSVSIHMPMLLSSTKPRGPFAAC